MRLLIFFVVLFSESVDIILLIWLIALRYDDLLKRGGSLIHEFEFDGFIWPVRVLHFDLTKAIFCQNFLLNLSCVISAFDSFKFVQKGRNELAGGPVAETELFWLFGGLL